MPFHMFVSLLRSPRAFGSLVFVLTTVSVLGGTLAWRRVGADRMPWRELDRSAANDPKPEAGLLEGLDVGARLPLVPGGEAATAPTGDTDGSKPTDEPQDRGAQDEDEARSVAERVEATRPRSVMPDLGRTVFEQRLTDIYRTAQRSVVHVTTHWRMRSTAGQGANWTAGTGSGFVWDENGYVVTSYGVVNGVDGALVRLADGSTFEARLVGDSAEYDIALLFIEAPRSLLRPIAIGEAHKLNVGQMVLGLGNPAGEEVLLQSGIVSGVDQVLSSKGTGSVLRSVIFTDLHLGNGMAGGPLLDSGGRMVGLRASVTTQPGSSFAIPVEIVNRVVPRIIREGHVPWPELGLSFAPTLMSARLGVEGVVIIEAIEGGPAQRAGLRSLTWSAPGRPRTYDLLVGIDGRPVGVRSDVDAALLDHAPGEPLALDIERGGETQRYYVDIE